MTQFSVVLPVRNGWPYVKECVESILAQDHTDFDFIVLDNQSTDNTMPWLRSLSDPRLRLYSSTQPLSIEQSWKRAVAVEKHEYMTLIGHDDLLDPSFLSTITTLIREHPDASLYQTNFRFINSDGKFIRKCHLIPERESPTQYIDGRFTFKRDITGTGVVMRSADYERLGGIPLFERLFFADDALWLSLMKGSYKACAPVEFFAVRMHGKKESTTKPSSWPSLLLGLNQFADFLREYQKGDAELRETIVQYAPPFMRRYHQNLYILALVEASQAGRTSDPAVLDQISSSFLKCSLVEGTNLGTSARVMAIEAMNATPFRRAVPLLWRSYNRFLMMAQ